VGNAIEEKEEGGGGEGLWPWKQIFSTALGNCARVTRSEWEWAGFWIEEADAETPSLVLADALVDGREIEGEEEEEGEGKAKVKGVSDLALRVFRPLEGSATLTVAALPWVESLTEEAAAPLMVTVI